MYKNVINTTSLLLFLFLTIFSACNPESNTRRLSSRSHKVKYNKVEKQKNYATSHSRSKNTESTSSRNSSNNSTQFFREIAVETAKKMKGIPYKYGGKTPETGFDCSGLVTYSYAQAGKHVYGSSDMLSKEGKKKPIHLAEAGDLAFFGADGKVSHVALVVSSDDHSTYVVHATSKGGVRMDDIRKSNYWQEKYLFTRDILQ